MSQSYFEDLEESQSQKLARKAKESPFVIAGLGGLASALGYGAYMYKNRGQMSTSVYLMQLRVTAQSAVVIALLGGVTYSLITQYVLSPKEKDKK
ncbi:HIG1 domain family member 1C-like [Artemia franciscana]|uniref:HIG1 domain-containing protein n=1 Tax=Artemia franciscana TaxID=6661 RepID=A0AA88IIG0_ARTSF|nr:hypothetical protein QYM36_003670 [Artemia franciscana]